MKKVLFILLTVLLLSACSVEKTSISIDPNIKPWSLVLPSEGIYTIIGDVKIVKDFEIKSLNRKRNIWIYLPPSYETTKAKYPVLYMQDGQSLFTSDNVEWQVDESLEGVFKDKKAPETIVVGIASDPETRFDEYSPWVNAVGDGGEGDKYVDFIVKELKPYMDKNFRTLSDRKHTAIAGASMGGYISLYAALKYQDTFGKVAAFSPIFGFNKPPYIEFMNSIKPDQDFKVYLDSGEQEREFPHPDLDVKEMGELLTSLGVSPNQLKLVIDKEGEHNKESWQKRFSEAFVWLMNP